MSLKEYRRKRKFSQTPEPAPRKTRAAKGPLRFVVQKHDATRTHYDFRLEFDGALKSWAVPKGPSLTSQDPRLAVKVEDHPLEYGSFEGVIPKGNYGAGTVMIWDSGTYTERSSRGRADNEVALRAALEKGHLTFILQGKKLRGEFALVKIKSKGAEEKAWLLIKKHDAEASRRDILREDRSVATGRSMAEIAAEAESRGEIWLPGKGRAKPRARTVARPKARSPIPRPPTKPDRAPAMPHRIRVMQPLSVSAAPTGSDWTYEPFGTGVRAIAEIEPGKVRLYSKSHLPFEKKFPTLVQALKKITGPAILDGEIVAEKNQPPIFVVSDLLYYGKEDLRAQPWSERRRRLTKLSLARPLRLVASSGAPGVGPMVAKRRTAPYQSGIAQDWRRFRVSGKADKARPVPAGKNPTLTHLDKVFWPDEGYTKGDLVRYYDTIADTILPYLIDRPQSLHRQPDGIRDEGFFHKDMTSFLPRGVKTERVFSESSGKTINYLLCQDRPSLLYLINLGCIELNPWLSRRPHLERPDWVVIDLDPDNNPFAEVIEVAREVHRVLEAVGVESYCKTSGATGLHICIPTGARYEYETGRAFAEAVCRRVQQKFPKFTSVERNPARRRGKIYLDFLQNRRAQTLAAPYCVRPRPKATVSTPLKWTEVKKGLNPEAFTIETLPRRLARVGDLWRPLLNSAVDIEAGMKRLLKLSHN